MTAELKWTAAAVRGLQFCLATTLLACGGGGEDESVHGDDSAELRANEEDDDRNEDGVLGSAGAGSMESEPDDHEASDPPPPLEQGGDAELCIISADCASGSHCDLGECVQNCHRDNPCEEGLICSARARCLDEGAEDIDPAPPTEKAGDVQVDPTATVLTEEDDRLLIRLTSSSREAVRYRIVTSAPYLSVQEPRGEFEEEVVLEIDVHSDGLQGRHMPGTVRILTNLGELTVDAPIRTGMTGAYEGSLEYYAGDVPLGQARLALDLLETNGDVQVRVHRDQSLLFPSESGEDTYGRGIFTVTGGVEFRISHLLPANAGGSRNRLGRPIGREVTMKLNPAAQGVLEGSFEEKIYGLFEQPVTLKGTMQLRNRPKEIIEEFEAPPKLDMPLLSLPPGGGQRYEIAEAADLATELSTGALDVSTCYNLAAAPVNPVPEPEVWFDCLKRADDFYFEALQASFAKTRASSAPLSNLRTACEEEMALDYRDFLALGDSRQCMLPSGPAAVLSQLEHQYSSSSVESSKLFHRSVARLLAGPLFVAQDYVVQAAKDSFVLGASNQRKRLEEARAALNDAGALVMQPHYLEYLRHSSKEGAAGEPASDDASQVDYPGFRALSRLLFVTSVIDEELSTLAAADKTRPQEERLVEAQESAVLTLVEAAILHAITVEWKFTPPGGGSELIGALAPMDSGFGILLHGATLFGVPTGEIPLSFDASRSWPTNFEQFLNHLAQPSVSLLRDDEASFTSGSREFEQNQAALETELSQLRASHEETIASICGNSFDSYVLETDEDWELCGADSTGSLAEARHQLELKHAEALSAQTRLEGMGEKIKIDHQTLGQTQAARGKTMSFIDKTNSEINAVSEVQNVLGAAVKALELASNASIGNGGAPIGMGVAAAILEDQQGRMEIRKDKLRQAQEMRQLEETTEIEFITGMAEIKKQLIDLHQLEIDLEQSAIGITLASIAITNQKELAQRAILERTRGLARISASPFSDPTYRTLLSRSALKAMSSRREAQRWLYRAGRALEYEINTPLGDALGRAVLSAHNDDAIESLSECYSNIFNEYASQFGIPQEFSTTLSVRKMLGVTAPRVDEVTGEQLSEGQLFRQILLQNENLDGEGGVGVQFSTNLDPGNQLWSGNLCDDKVASIRAQIVGDFQGDDEAEVVLFMEGSGLLRRCDSEELINWTSESVKKGVLQAGVNGFGSAPANSTLFGHSVARPSWRVLIPGRATAPANADLRLDAIEDIVLEVKHRALPTGSQSVNLDLSCLSGSGSGI
jgi:hypothetical protein